MSYSGIVQEGDFMENGFSHAGGRPPDQSSPEIAMNDANSILVWAGSAIHITNRNESSMNSDSNKDQSHTSFLEKDRASLPLWAQ
ncbi:hypothetical protein C5167_002258 [Papaver somniferum]|uniref:Uncharacterized protein n=1 Tax=Papaver somniferum TaxID=3469 RepID=A0A4Y7KVJ2_PAPSO|nr:hypothetical protein C5167_002258 [Papaver somniferum]